MIYNDLDEICQDQKKHIVHLFDECAYFFMLLVCLFVLVEFNHMLQSRKN